MFEDPRIPTDREILKEIYDRYYEIFAREPRERLTKILVPIDIKGIASKFEVDGDIVFGRLYYHLERKYGYTKADGGNVSLFALWGEKDGKGERHLVNFPYLTSVLVDLERQHKEFLFPNIISFFALAVSIAAFLVAMFR